MTGSKRIYDGELSAMKKLRRVHQHDLEPDETELVAVS